ncbi:MAG TPA: LuxR C-terminal-related transcriptional regulator, partial [Dehalococcoidia bacterium]|nr:LuxR C-terminal-related transcriptional regulator [Dehalococcoidia bacterium]
PTGTITFLFTDVEGSSRPWEEHPAAMRQAMARHDALLATIVEQHDGVVVRPRGEGDSLFCVFVRASDAVAAALDGQRALAAEDWGIVGAIRVRMALLTGEADLRAGDYYGSAVNRCARIRSAGYGGQTLLAQTTVELVRSSLPPGASLRSLGVHRLRGAGQPETIHQLEAPDLAATFPPLKTEVDRPNNLPLSLTSFIGRERELDAVLGLVLQHRLVTLTGPGGTGKTRLAIRAAEDLLDAFPGGVFFVDLAPLRDPEHVPAALARVLGLRESPEQPLIDTLRFFLRERTVLLVLDNFEHLMPAAPFVAGLLSACPGLRVLATSREPLRLSGERQYPVPPLPLPEGEAADETAIAESAAVVLFVERAREVRPDFALSTENAAAVSAICARLDGLPLAIELAAVRVKALPPAALLARLDQRLPLLTGGPRDAPARQQTLRDTIAWSYALLPPAEQTLFRRLGIFVGGCTLDAAEAVCDSAGDLGIATIDGLASLVEKSLVRPSMGIHAEPRFTMLETVREFALGHLEAGGEAETLQQGLAEYFIALAERADLGRRQGDSDGWAQILETEQSNVRTALAWALRCDDAVAGSRLLDALCWFWGERAQFNEANQWAAAVLTLPSAARGSPARARALHHVASTARVLGDFARCDAYLEESIAISRAGGDLKQLARSLLEQGLRWRSDDLTENRRLIEESLSLFRRLGDLSGVAEALERLGTVAIREGDAEAARTLFTEALNLSRQIGDSLHASQVLLGLAQLTAEQGDTASALAYFEQHLRLSRELKAAGSILDTLPNVIFLRSLRGETAGLGGLLAENLQLLRERSAYVVLPGTLEMAGAVAMRWRRWDQAARLFGAAEGLREARGVGRATAYRDLYRAGVELLRRRLGDQCFDAAWTAGRALSRDEAIDEALALAADLREAETPRTPLQEPTQDAPAPSTLPAGLSLRETEVLRLLAAGRSNRDIAEALVLSIRTVEAHVARVYQKIGAANRAEATAYVVRHRLA